MPIKLAIYGANVLEAACKSVWPPSTAVNAVVIAFKPWLLGLPTPHFAATDFSFSRANAIIMLDAAMIFI